MAFSDNQIRVVGIIPARYASTRFPGKPLALISGISMIQRVYNQASTCKDIHSVIVATDDQRIADHVAGFGGRVMMTDVNHRSGTDRLGEVLGRLKTSGEHFDIAVNIQGDEPFIQPEQISRVIRLFSNPETEIATLIKQIDAAADLDNPNVVKVVTDASGRAMLFSRAAVPHFRGLSQDAWINNYRYFKHIGIYAYRTSVLEKLVQLEPAPPELAESLEQLRWLWNGYRIYTDVTEYETIGVDTPEDLLKLTNIS
ncbi:MAG: 3-deoxy-manno-octulosonate cytidylyltransferase (CMP-KDO synthetase) [Bacteroidetes bacterium]|nr:MAG: 3-deoxy-manno-octulosonate cytidylyltransferase (CMP-KDO synthetase) [Bacteroidota bacterium]